VCWKVGREEGEEKFIPLGELKATIVKITPGQKITYITDAIYNEENARKIVRLAEASDLMFIEATFLHEDTEKATKKYHLTALQAGTLARMAGAKRISLFHFSPKYKGIGNNLVEEATRAFNGV
jgi:ribonuclease Z